MSIPAMSSDTKTPLRQQDRREYGGKSRWFVLLLASLCVAAVWISVLPRIGREPSVRRSIDRREALGINAEAMFYTELEAMETLVLPWEPTD